MITGKEKAKIIKICKRQRDGIDIFLRFDEKVRIVGFDERITLGYVACIQ